MLCGRVSLPGLPRQGVYTKHRILLVFIVVFPSHVNAGLSCVKSKSKFLWFRKRSQVKRFPSRCQTKTPVTFSQSRDLTLVQQWSKPQTNKCSHKQISVLTAYVRCLSMVLFGAFCLILIFPMFLLFIAKFMNLIIGLSSNNKSM